DRQATAAGVEHRVHQVDRPADGLRALAPAEDGGRAERLDQRLDALCQAPYAREHEAGLAAFAGPGSVALLGEEIEPGGGGGRVGRLAEEPGQRRLLDREGWRTRREPLDDSLGAPRGGDQRLEVATGAALAGDEIQFGPVEALLDQEALQLGIVLQVARGPALA